MAVSAQVKLEIIKKEVATAQVQRYISDSGMLGQSSVALYYNLGVVNNRYYTARMYFGSTKQKADLILATSSDWTYVTSNYCGEAC